MSKEQTAEPKNQLSTAEYMKWLSERHQHLVELAMHYKFITGKQLDGLTAESLIGWSTMQASRPDPPVKREPLLSPATPQ